MNNIRVTESELLSTVVLKSFIFWDTAPDMTLRMEAI
jgi:hypothetical protein